ASDRLDPAVGDVDEDRAFFPTFAYAASLKVAGVDDPRIARDDLEGVHMAERPVVVPLCGEFGGRAGRVVLVARTAAGRMQNPDVEPAGDRFGVIERVVFGDLASRKAAAVERDAQFLEPVRLRSPGRKLEDLIGPSQRTGHDAIG